MKNRQYKIIINQIGNWNYFMWFLLGLYETSDLKFKAGILPDIASNCNLSFISGVLRKIYEKNNKEDLLKGELYFENCKISFAIDPFDSPNMYDVETLKECDIYFKMQCPKKFDKDGFYLTDSVILPWCDVNHDTSGKRRIITEELFKYINKIRPLCVGPRKLSNGISYKLLKKGYENYINFKKDSKKTKKMMCYFGNAKGPVPKEVDKASFDPCSEAQLMYVYGKELSHPNEKRAIAANYMKKLGDEYDARIISQGNSDYKDGRKNMSLVIPIEKFCSHIAGFDYNLNISGYRLSVPNRFIESFMVGTAIITDKLYLKWYLPFEDEVKETVQMGYLKNESVNWKKFEEDIINLEKQDRTKIIELYTRKWSPIAVANYIIDTLIDSKRG